jgi:very-short-patch-repair endonuclease
MTAPHRAEWRQTRPEAELGATRPDVLVSQLAARAWSALSVAELMACGLDHDSIAVRVDSGWLHPMFRGVYAVGHANPPREGWYLGAVKACGDGALLARHASSFLWKLAEPFAVLPDVMVFGRRAPDHPAIRGHRTDHLPPEDVAQRYGIPVTSPLRTVLDLAGDLEYAPLRRLVREAQSRKLVDLAELTRRLRGPGPRRGRAKLRRIVATGPAPTRSELEDVVLDLLLDAGFAHPDVNEPLRIGGRRVVPDFRWPEQRLIIEADGASYHDDPLARADDAERQALLEAHGERVLRVTWAQAVERGAETLRRVGAAGAPKG